MYQDNNKQDGPMATCLWLIALGATIYFGLYQLGGM
jgi:hypothetical protein